MNIRSAFSVFAAAILAAALTAGCNGSFWQRNKPVVEETIPEPIDTLLPKQIRIHPFTGMSVFSEKGDIRGIDVRIEAIDAYGDANKAFGQFRFELYQFKPNSPDPRGVRLAVWNESIEDFKSNRRHWNSIARIYQFKLAWNRPTSVGQKFVLAVVFQSRFTERLFTERVFESDR
ncbi:MAG: hypothetical protein SVV80_00475 [Planctomycetota bacterium]|nr:hypothetical protein [Planctomycetota bacterium]